MVARISRSRHEVVEFSAGPDCAGLWARAERIAPVLGPVRPDHVASVLYALTVLHKPEPDPDHIEPEAWRVMLRHLHPLESQLRWLDPIAPSPDRCSPRPWAHVSLHQRAALRTAYADVLRERLATSEPPVALACPWIGCLLCGLASIPMSAVEVVRPPDRDTARSATVWPLALGTHGPDLVRGHLCPTCAAVVESEGAVGPPARDRLVVAHVRETMGEERAAHIREGLAVWVTPPPRSAWGALAYAAARDGRPAPNPNATPWVYLSRVLARI